MKTYANKDGSRTVSFNHDPADAHSLSGGTQSNISWGNPDTMKGLRVMFGCREDELLVAVQIDAYGIKAKFERKR